jgi:hypothetical protein
MVLKRREAAPATAVETDAHRREDSGAAAGACAALHPLPCSCSKAACVPSMRLVTRVAWRGVRCPHR